MVRQGVGLNELRSQDGAWQGLLDVMFHIKIISLFCAQGCVPVCAQIRLFRVCVRERCIILIWSERGLGQQLLPLRISATTSALDQNLLALLSIAHHTRGC
jgi:hypothetical protein